MRTIVRTWQWADRLTNARQVVKGYWSVEPFEMPVRPDRLSQRSSQSPEDEVKCRRERGKLAQRAFRQRQIDTIRSLKERNQKLCDAISTIGQAAAVGNAALSKAIADAQRLALSNTSADAAEDIQNQKESDEDLSASHGESEMSNDCRIMKQYLFDSTSLKIQQQERQNPSVAMVLSTENHGFCTPASTGGPTADINYDFYAGLEADRNIMIAWAPPDIKPFTGAAAYTVAGQIHWVTLAYSYAAVKAVRDCPNNRSSEAFEFVNQGYGEALRHVSLDSLYDLVHGRLLFRTQGFIAGEHAARDPDLGKAMTLSIIATYSPRPSSDYLTAFDVAEGLRTLLGSRYTSFEDTLTGRITDDRVRIMRSLMKFLARRGVCFGDGPRWRQDDLSEVCERWLIETYSFT
ncbi:hypothetical protein JX265_001198 [Neoarthrinium moseri]|uniref:Uncharacterized protein n=1 Tax=Neoarthrinium moseri TaxID=1658444 RepID=A0A9P9WXL0_9PEZI|nr:hypothetical protein JX265_001198 [Neoarthrinium moseri]